eukprot:scaffold27058_cov151-Skeletonema_menzelii.AAC.4
MACAAEMFCFSPRQRRRTISPLIVCLSISILSLQFILTSGALLSSTNGPEDKFFCGWNWDDEDCATRQHCPSGRSEECDGFENGQKCFANTECDVKVGDGSWYAGYEPGAPRPRPPRPSPGGTERPVYGRSDDPTDHYFCGKSMDDAINKCATHCPSGQSVQCPHGELCFFDVYSCNVKNMITPTLWPTYTPPTGSPFSGPGPPTKIPTEMPIPPPDPLDYPSDDLTDHWYCGSSLYDANNQCKQHCPTAMECPMGQICFFGTTCDARTYAPTPPPTRRPTKPPTEYPTMNPTVTTMPTPNPTDTMPPSNEPTEQIPTRSPTQSPTKRPTYAPMPSLMSSFFCGADWHDAITNCKKRCPSSDDSECPFDEHCYSLTPCTEEKGYPDSYYENEEGTAGTGGGGSSGQSEACVPFEVTITADYWPKENSWAVENTKTGEVIAEGNNDILEPGVAVKYPVKCINDKLGCYTFVIKDTGGDGLCCEHGNGSYTAKYDGEVIKTGSSFYDDEKAPFGLCGVSQAPTPSPQKDGVSFGTSADGTAYRCVPKPLVQADDWFCDEDAECIEAPKCNGVEEAAGSSFEAGGSYRCVADELADNGYVVSKQKCDFFDPCYNAFIKEGDQFFCNEGFSCIRATECGKEEAVPAELPPPTIPPPSTTQPPRPPPLETSTETAKPTSIPARPIVPRPARPTNPPTPEPTHYQSAAPTFVPTTYHPTHGPCSGAACNQRDQCRSVYGFCGPGEIYCNSEAIWTKDCPNPEPSPPPSSPPPPPRVPLPSVSPLTLLPAIVVTEPPSVAKQISAAPTTEKPIWLKPKPSGNVKPKPSGGGKPKPPSLTNPITPSPAEEPVEELTIEPQPTLQPSSSPQSNLGTFLINNPESPKTPNPTAVAPEVTTAKPVLPTMYTSTDPPSASPAAEAPTNEFECTGDPCPVDIHCRSRYGSCGPGFIYCNAQSIWTMECPPIIPGETPTRNPTRKPTKSPSTVDEPSPTPVFGIPNIVIDKADPTFPPIPKPTLPTITDGTPFSPSFFENAFAESDKNDKEESEAKTNETMESADNAKLNADFSPSEESTFESDEYLDAWIKMRESESNGVSGTFIYSIGVKITYGVVVLCMIENNL